AGARRDTPQRRRSQGHRGHLAHDVDARAALHPAARQDPGSRGAAVTRDELQRLIDVIVSEMSAASASGVKPGAPCACPGVLNDCCPDRLRPVIDAGATRVGVHALGGAPAGVAAMIDHTLLKPDATRQSIEELCREAAQFRFATVCVNPTWVALCARLLS